MNIDCLSHFDEELKQTNLLKFPSLFNHMGKDHLVRKVMSWGSDKSLREHGEGHMPTFPFLAGTLIYPEWTQVVIVPPGTFLFSSLFKRIIRLLSKFR